MISQNKIAKNPNDQPSAGYGSEKEAVPTDVAEGTKIDAKPVKNRGEKFYAILDAAESIFATCGFSGASMREIAEKASVAQALIHYHFDTKERLFEEVVARRSGEINQMRKERLEALFEKSSTPALEDITDVLLRPTIEVGHRNANSSNDYARILVSTANSSDELSTKLTSRYYDPIAKQFIAAFQKAAPGLNHENAVWAYLFAIGVGMTMMAQTGRSQRLSGGLCDDRDIEAMLARIIPFITAGIRSVIGVTSPPTDTKDYQHSKPGGN